MQTVLEGDTDSPGPGGAGTEALHSWGHEQVKSRLADQLRLVQSVGHLQTRNVHLSFTFQMLHMVWQGLFFSLCYSKAELKQRNQKLMAQSDKECEKQNTKSPSSLNIGLFSSNE